ncbi:MAG TPA: hypothetical protein VJK26_00615 [Patescibacteria group bacterium]|nr:hypothetical protein [Patescibacteria group bacterium]
MDQTKPSGEGKLGISEKEEQEVISPTPEVSPPPVTPESRPEETPEPEMVIEEPGENAGTSQNKSSPPQAVAGEIGPDDVTADINTVGQASRLAEIINSQNGT